MGREHGRTAGLGWAARRLATSGVAVCALAACGNVIVNERDEPGTTVDTGGSASTAPTTTTPPPTTTSVPDSTTTGGPTTGSGSCVSACAEGFTNGALPCYGLAFGLYTQLLSTVCDNLSGCGQVCNDNLCDFAASAPACTACLQAQYPEALQNCLAH